MEVSRIEVEVQRGVAPAILLTQIKNTAPFIYDSQFKNNPPTFITRIVELNPDLPLSHFEYFKLCVSAHAATVGTFVPTDVDNQIRFRLWNPQLSKTVLKEMAEFALTTKDWNYSSVNRRFVDSLKSGNRVGGQDGEWFSILAGAYCALKKRDADFAARLGGELLHELVREEEIFKELVQSGDGIGALSAATLIAHNLGDLERVFEMWNLPDDDALKEKCVKIISTRFVKVAALNKKHMAAENHRHFALRRPKCLRRSADFLLGVGPFFEEWGRKIARHPGLSSEEVAEIVEALCDGYENLKEPSWGYPRALAGILENFPGGFSKLSNYLPGSIERKLKAGDLRMKISVSEKRFSETWRHYGLQ